MCPETEKLNSFKGKISQEEHGVPKLFAAQD
jgi:hypothetical protein